MEENFAEGWRAAAFVAQGIAADAPTACPGGETMLEVTLHKRGKLVRRFCFLDTLERVVGALCAEFPRAVVQYHPDSAYGFIAQIRCICGNIGSEGCCRFDGHDHATVTVVRIQEKLSVEQPDVGSEVQ